MQEVKRLKRRFVVFSESVVVAFCAVIICIIMLFSAGNAHEQTYTLMAQIAAKPALLENAGSETPFPYFAVTHTQGANYVVGNAPIESNVTAQLPELIGHVLEASEDRGEIMGDNLLWYKTQNERGQVIIFADISAQSAQMVQLFAGASAVAAGFCVLFFFFARAFAKQTTRPLERAFEEQRRFVSDASHELKTPLTVIITNAEIASDTDADTNRRNKATTNILSTAKRMKRLSEELLDLSRTQEVAADVSSMDASCNLSRIANDVALSYEALCFERGYELALSIASDVHAQMPAQKAEQLISTLLDNATKYAEGAGAIEVRVEQGAKNTCVLGVSNPAPKISDTDLRHLFDRFWRADKARAHSGSYGLGLAIAKSIVEATGGSISASWENGRLHIVATCPLGHQGL